MGSEGEGKWAAEGRTVGRAAPSRIHLRTQSVLSYVGSEAGPHDCPPTRSLLVPHTCVCSLTWGRGQGSCSCL